MTHFISESTVHEYQYSIEHFPETSSLMTSGYGTNYDFSICCHAPSRLDPGEPSHMHIHLTMDCDLTQLNASPCVGNVEYSLTRTSPGRQGWRVDSTHTIFIHLAYNTL